MGITNKIISWYFKNRLGQIEKFSNDPLKIQRQVYNNLITSASNTVWGQKYDYASLRDQPAEFAKRLPLSDYVKLKPWIERVMKGEKNVLWPGEINWFAQSSGTTNDKSKYIPISKESLQDCHYKAGKDLYALYYNLNPNAGLGNGKNLVLGGSHNINKMDNGNSRYGDLSAVLLQNLPFLAEMKRTPELHIALMEDWEEKIEKIALNTINENVTHLMGVPTWTIILIKKLFEISGKNNLLEIWPELELYIHGGVSFSPYKELFKGLIVSDKMHYLETYNASEGFFSIQDRLNSDDMLLMLDYGVYYELLPMSELDKENPETITLADAEIDKNYGIIISTNGGLWRYLIGDTIKFTSLSPFRIKVTGRTKHFINAFGEELIIENVENAFYHACNKTDSIITDYTAAPVYFSDLNNGQHEYLIEFEKLPSCMDTFCQEFDDSLKKINSDYEAKRYKSIALGKPLIREMKKGTFYNWMKKRGKLGGQNKVPRLSNDRQYVEDILKYVEKLREEDSLA